MDRAPLAPPLPPHAHPWLAHLRVARPHAMQQLEVVHRGRVEQHDSLGACEFDAERSLDKHGGLVLPEEVDEAAQCREAQELPEGWGAARMSWDARRQVRGYVGRSRAASSDANT